MKISSENKSKLNIAVIMLILAVIAMITATYAWFSLSLTAKINTMDLEVTAGEHIRIDVSNKGTDIADWDKSELNNADIERTLGKRLSDYKILPVTSGNGKTFYSKNGNEVEASSLKYLQFDVWMISSVDVDVYLTEENSDAGSDGTLVSTTGGTDVVNSVRISFDAGGSGAAPIYAPARSGGSTTLDVNAAGSTQRHFTNASASDSDSNLFPLSANVPKKITITIWLEGADPDNDSDQENSDFKTRLRFEGVE